MSVSHLKWYSVNKRANHPLRFEGRSNSPSEVRVAEDNYRLLDWRLRVLQNHMGSHHPLTRP